MIPIPYIKGFGIFHPSLILRSQNLNISSSVSLAQNI